MELFRARRSHPSVVVLALYGQLSPALLTSYFTFHSNIQSINCATPTDRPLFISTSFQSDWVNPSRHPKDRRMLFHSALPHLCIDALNSTEIPICKYDFFFEVIT
jgi:hypothetical protein